MELKKMLEISELLQIYGGLLTQRQQEVMKLYYDEDFSLGEIGEELEISRQAIHDTVKKSEKLLYGYEEALRFRKVQEEKKKLFCRIEESILKLKAFIKSGDTDAAVKTVEELSVMCEELSG